jgi:hypothetical protein
VILLRITLNIRIHVVVLLAMAIHPVLVSAQSPAENLDEILKLSGLKTQVGQIPVEIKTDFVRQQQAAEFKLTPKNSDRILKILMESYNASDLEQSVVDHLKEHYDPARASAELEMLRSPLSRKMTKLETAASAPEAQKEIQAYANKLRSQPPEPERVALVKRLDRVTGTTDLSLELLVAISMVNVGISNDFNPPEKRLKPDQLEQMAGRMRKEMAGPVENSTFMSFLYMYRDVPDRALKEYVDLYDNETTAWFKRLVKGALVSALTAAAGRAGHQIAKMFPKAST